MEKAACRRILVLKFKSVRMETGRFREFWFCRNVYCMLRGKGLFVRCTRGASKYLKIYVLITYKTICKGNLSKTCEACEPLNLDIVSTEKRSVVLCYSVLLYGGTYQMNV